MTGTACVSADLHHVPQGTRRPRLISEHGQKPRVRRRQPGQSTSAHSGNSSELADSPSDHDSETGHGAETGAEESDKQKESAEATVVPGASTHQLVGVSAIERSTGSRFAASHVVAGDSTLGSASLTGGATDPASSRIGVPGTAPEVHTLPHVPKLLPPLAKVPLQTAASPLQFVR